MEDSEIFTKPRLSKKQKYIFITACNFPYLISWISGQSRGAITAMNQFFLTAGMKYGGKFVCTNAGKKGVLKTVIKKLRGIGNEKNKQNQEKISCFHNRNCRAGKFSRFWTLYMQRQK